MKCDVCGYKVSRYDRNCPNCGYQLRKEVKIETTIYEDLNDRGIKNKKNTFLDKVELKAIKSRTKIPNVKIILIVFGFVVGLTLFSIIDPFHNKTDSVFETVLKERGDDSYHTLEKAIEYRDRLLEDYDQLRLVYNNEEVFENNGYIETVGSMIYDIKYQNYTLTYVFRNGAMVGLYVETERQIGLGFDKFPFDEIDVFNTILGYDSVVDEFNKIKANQPIGMYYNDDQLIIREEYVDYDSFNVYYKIAGKGYKIN